MLKGRAIFHLSYRTSFTASYFIYRISCMNDMVHERLTICNFRHPLSLSRLLPCRLIRGRIFHDGEACGTKSTQRTINSSATNARERFRVRRMRAGMFGHERWTDLRADVLTKTAIVAYGHSYPRPSLRCLPSESPRVGPQMESRSRAGTARNLGIAASETGIVAGGRLSSPRSKVYIITFAEVLMIQCRVKPGGFAGIRTARAISSTYQVTKFENSRECTVELETFPKSFETR